jgi:hypothetical protein
MSEIYDKCEGALEIQEELLNVGVKFNDRMYKNTFLDQKKADSPDSDKKILKRIGGY